MTKVCILLPWESLPQTNICVQCRYYEISVALGSPCFIKFVHTVSLFVFQPHNSDIVDPNFMSEEMKTPERLTDFIKDIRGSQPQTQKLGALKQPLGHYAATSTC